MRDTDVIEHIIELCKKRNWTYYRLAVQAKIPYSTLNNMIHRANIPTITTLQKICDGFGISLSDFFAENPKNLNLTKDQAQVLNMYDDLDKSDQNLLLAYAKGLSHIK